MAAEVSTLELKEEGGKAASNIWMANEQMKSDWWVVTLT